MTLEGRIAIDLFSGAPLDGAARIVSSRPLALPNQFAGHRPQDVLQMVSLLFAVCGAAQSVAAAEAFEEALCIQASAPARRVRALLVLNETAREHALRIIMDWPGFLGEGEAHVSAPSLKTLMLISRDLAHIVDSTGTATAIGGEATVADTALEDAAGRLKAFLASAIFGEDLASWQKRTTKESLAEWAGRGQLAAQRLLSRALDWNLAAAGSAELSPLPRLGRARLFGRLFAPDADDFIAKPVWEGSPRETSPLTRQRAHPLVAALSDGTQSGLGARLVACLAELAAIPDQMLALKCANLPGLDTPQNCAPADGLGLAEVEAARGRLIHAVRMDGDRVACYRILAPTEWNFHPQGAAARGLARLAGSGRGNLQALARLFIMAADPCTGYEIRVH